MINVAAAIKANATYRQRLFWTPAVLGLPATVSDSDLVTAVADTQKQLGLTVDGICGPATYGKVLEGHEERLIASANGLAPATRMNLIGKAAVIRAERTWLLDIQDGKAGTFPEASRKFIDAIMRTDAGVGWSWLKEYRGDGQFEWCTTFIAYCINKVAPIPLKPWRFYFFASTDRLEALSHYDAWQGEIPNPKPASGPYHQVIELDETSQAHECRFADGSLPRAGDIVLVGGVHTGAGRHGVLAVGYNENTGVFDTWEGNATGLGPKGVLRQGVIKATRRVGLLPGASKTTYHVRRVIRLAPHIFA